MMFRAMMAGWVTAMALYAGASPHSLTFEDLASLQRLSDPQPSPDVFCGGGVLGLAPEACWRWGLRGIGPALAGNVGAGWAFALSREGDQDVDVPMLAPARARCRFVEAQEASGEGEAFGMPQRGTAYQPGVKPRVWRITGAF